MDIGMNGKKIAAVYWPDTESEQGRCLVSGKQWGELHLSVTHNVFYDEFWIVLTKNGTEVSRHNPRFTETIVWA